MKNKVWLNSLDTLRDILKRFGNEEISWDEAWVEIEKDWKRFSNYARRQNVKSFEANNLEAEKIFKQLGYSL